MRFYFVPNLNGDIKETGCLQDGALPNEAIICDASVMNLISGSHNLIRWDDQKLCFPQDDFVIWKALTSRGSWTGIEAFEELANLRGIRNQIAHDTEKFNLETSLDSPLTIHEFPISGLKWRAFYLNDLEMVTPRIIESAIYPQTCPEDSNCHCYPKERHPTLMLASRITNPAHWNFILEFDGEPIQFESIYHDNQRVVIDLTVHFMRERPHWFWRECEKPIFEKIIQNGFTSLESRARKDRPDWIEALKFNYQAKEIREEEKVKILQYPLDLSLFKGFPQRRILGWSTKVDDIYMREAVEEDFPAIEIFLGQSWKENAQRLTLVNRMLREWYCLDQATIILAFKGNDLIQVYMVRQRKDQLSSVSFLISLLTYKAQDFDLMSKAVREWQIQAGYKESSFWLNQNGWAKMEPHALRQGWEIHKLHKQFREPMVELRMKL